MKSLLISIVLLFLGIFQKGISQEIIYDTEYKTYPQSILKDNNGDFIITGYENIQDSGYFWRSFIIKMTPDFDTTVKIIDDTLNQLAAPSLLITNNNKYIVNFVELLENSGIYFDQLSFMVFDEDLNVLSFKRYDMSPAYNALHLLFIQNDNGRIYGSGLRGIGNNVLVMEINEMGDTLRSKLINSPGMFPSFSSIMKSHNDTVAFHTFINAWDPSADYTLTTFDTNFNYNYTNIVFDDNKIPYDIRGNWINDSIIMGVGFIPLGSYVKDLAVFNFNVNQQQIIGDYLYIARPDTQDIPALNIPTFVDPDYIYIGSYRGSFPGSSYNGRYMVCIIDENLNLIGMKSLGKDGYQYDMTTMQATDDLGCMVIGTRHDNANAPESDFDIFIRKIMPGEIVGVAEQTEDPYDSDYFVYPNPGRNELNINTARKGVRLKIVNTNGKQVFTKQLNDTFLNTLNLSVLPSGTYILQFKDKEGYEESIKWIKK